MCMHTQKTDLTNSFEKSLISVIVWYKFLTVILKIEQTFCET